jgi:hypothetical protein
MLRATRSYSGNRFIAKSATTELKQAWMQFATKFALLRYPFSAAFLYSVKRNVLL